MECARIARPGLALALALMAALALLAPPVLADNSVQGTLPASTDPGVPSAALWTFAGPADGSTVTLALTYTPNGAIVDSTGQPYDNLIGFNVYGEDGRLFAKSTLIGTGARRFSFQSTSAHQYGVQVFNYAESSAVAYTLAISGASLAAVPASSAAVAPAGAVPSIAPPASPAANAAPDLGAVLRATGDHVQGRLIGTLPGATQDYEVAATPDGSTITLRLSAEQADLIAGAQAGVNVYQMQGGVKVLIAVGLPPASDPTVSLVTFSGASEGYGDFIAEVYNAAPATALDYRLTRG